jgi:hypothetical protein
MYRFLQFFLLLATSASISINVYAATVTGVITDITDGQPIAGASVTLSRSSLFLLPLGNTVTNHLGEFSITNAYAGAAHLKVTATGFSSAEAYFTMPTGNGMVTQNLSMAGHAQISGRAIRDTTGSPISGITVRLHSVESGVLFQETGLDGAFHFPELAPGEYSVCVLDGTDEFIDQCWNDITANAFNFPTNFTPVVLQPREHRQGIELRLRNGATISGTISNRITGQPVAADTATITLFREQNDFREVPIEITPDGIYVLRGIAPGIYRAIVRISAPYHTPQIFRDIDCVDATCTVTSGAPIVVDQNLTSHHDVDFRLLPGGRVAGRVRSSATRVPIAGARVEVWEMDHFIFPIFNKVGQSQTDGNGAYSIGNLKSTRQHLVIIRGGDFISQRWPGINCFMDCTTGATNGVTAPDGQLVVLDDFLLDQGARIEGWAHQPGLSGGVYQVSLFDSNANLLGWVQSDRFGRYQLPAWYPGTYFLRSARVGGDECENYLGLSCSIPIGNATPVVLATVGQVVQADFTIPVEVIFSERFESP